MFTTALPKVTSKKFNDHPDCIIIIKNGKLVQANLNINSNIKDIKQILYDLLNSLKRSNN